MKTKFLTIISCGLLLLAAGCKKQQEPVNPDKQSFSANVARPEWAAPKDYDCASSMTAVVQVDLAAQYPTLAADFVLDDNDLIAAFSGETCLGTATPDDGLFFLYVTWPSSLQGEEGEWLVTLRYYSAHYKNIFEAKDAFPYVNDSRQGSADTPFLPAFVVTK